MKVNLFPFQKVALSQLRLNTATALGNYRATHTPQIVSYTAPTGAGKTIIMASLIESIYCGDENYPDQNDAIFVWLSDSPQLNEQSRLKIETKADKCFGRCITISDDSFDRDILEDGHIYFLNTQKLSKNSNLTKRSDSRDHTIWETLANTVREKSDRFYFIIDEAHRGAQKSTDLAKATTIMQKFLRGSQSEKLPAMPVVIGITATPQRFRRLAEDIQSTTHYVNTTTDDVRASGLLKDRIVITYPETAGNDMAVLQAASDEWKNKWDHWNQYCSEQHHAQVNPVFVVQVQNRSGSRLTYTDLDECIRIIEQRTGMRFSEGQVVHAFGEGTPAVQANGLNIPYCEPSRISDDKRIRLVFFKETLSTGWDCPRAETMMSFRHATDYTYIAQLLGRMVRTPMQQHINVDETLNDVHLYLPQFDERTVYDVVEALRSSEGANIPTDIESEMLGTDNYDTLTLRPTYTQKPGAGRKAVSVPGQMSLFDLTEDTPMESPAVSSPANTIPAYTPSVVSNATEAPASSSAPTTTTAAEPIKPAAPVAEQPVAPAPTIVAPPVEEKPEGSDIDREGVVKAINDAGLLTYDVRKLRITDYSKSLYALARFLTMTRIDLDAKENVIRDIVTSMHDFIAGLKKKGEYEELVGKVLEFKLNTQIFDVFGRSIDNNSIHDLLSTTDTDIERQFRLAEARLGNEGVGNAYCLAYDREADPITNRIEVVICVSQKEFMDQLDAYAKRKFHELNDENRRKTVSLPERFKKKYDDIVSDGDIVSKHNFKLPETIRVPRDASGKLYANHLFVDDSGTAMISLNSWEERTIEEEQKQSDFVCWLRNPSRGSWALCIPYELDGEQKPTYPDFLVIRKVDNEYVVDILEPHDPTRADNFGKAKGFAEYARQNPGVGRIQLIKMKRDSLGEERPFRLDMSKSSVRDRVLHCASMAELNNIFEEYGFFI